MKSRRRRPRGRSRLAPSETGDAPWPHARRAPRSTSRPSSSWSAARSRSRSSGSPPSSASRRRRSPRCSGACAPPASWRSAAEGAASRLTRGGQREGATPGAPAPPQRALPRRLPRHAVGRRPRRGLQARARAQPRGRGAAGRAARQPAHLPARSRHPRARTARSPTRTCGRSRTSSSATRPSSAASPRRASELLRYLASLGLLPDTPVEVESVAPFNGPLLVRVAGSQYALGREVAGKIMVRGLTPWPRRVPPSRREAASVPRTTAAGRLRRRQPQRRQDVAVQRADRGRRGRRPTTPA